jgi:hypothetical protein
MKQYNSRIPSGNASKFPLVPPEPVLRARDTLEGQALSFCLLPGNRQKTAVETCCSSSRFCGYPAPKNIGKMSLHKIWNDDLAHLRKYAVPMHIIPRTLINTVYLVLTHTGETDSKSSHCTPAGILCTLRSPQLSMERKNHTCRLPQLR